MISTFLKKPITISYSTHGDMDDPRKTKNRQPTSLGKKMCFKIASRCYYDTESLINYKKINRQVSEIDNYKYSIKYDAFNISRRQQNNLLIMYR